ncbi:MAG: ABC transporter permease [Spirochaetota bacterium]
MKKKGPVLTFFTGFTGLLLTVIISFLLVIIFIFLLSKEPGKTIYFFFLGAFTNKYYFGNMLNSAVPLVFTGLGIASAFKSSVFNLGGEGQVYAGGLITTVVCLVLPSAGGYAGGIAAVAAAVIAGGLLAGLSGFFRMKWKTDEMISSFLISGAVVLFVNYFITGPLDDPNNNLLATYTIGSQYSLLKIFPPSKLNISAVFSLLTALLVFLFLYKSHWGYEMRMCGLNREFSRYGGINVSRYLVFPMVLSGALHGLAGGISILGTYGVCLKGFSVGMGWNGIAVALIAKNNPLGVIPAAIFFAFLEAGAKAAMLHSDVTFEIAAIAQSFIFYLVTAQALYVLVKRQKKVLV